MPGSFKDAVQTGPPGQTSDTDPFAVPVDSSRNQGRRGPERRTAGPIFYGVPTLCLTQGQSRMCHRNRWRESPKKEAVEPERVGAHPGEMPRWVNPREKNGGAGRKR